MKKTRLILIAVASVALSGCATYQGGTADDYYYYEPSPEPAVPMNSPTFRPGMNPDDPRDPTHLTRPQPRPPGTP